MWLLESLQVLFCFWGCFFFWFVWGFFFFFAFHNKTTVLVRHQPPLAHPRPDLAGFPSSRLGSAPPHCDWTWQCLQIQLRVTLRERSVLTVFGAAALFPHNVLTRRRTTPCSNISSRLVFIRACSRGLLNPSSRRRGALLILSSASLSTGIRWLPCFVDKCHTRVGSLVLVAAAARKKGIRVRVGFSKSFPSPSLSGATVFLRNRKFQHHLIRERRLGWENFLTCPVTEPSPGRLRSPNTD